MKRCGAWGVSGGALPSTVRRGDHDGRLEDGHHGDDEPRAQGMHPTSVTSWCNCGLDPRFAGLLHPCRADAALSCGPRTAETPRPRLDSDCIIEGRHHRGVTINDQRLPLEPSLAVRAHLPTGIS